MPPKVLLPPALIVTLAACGSSSSNSAPPSGPTTTIHIAEQASDTPSESAKMVCAKEAQQDIEQQDTSVPIVKLSGPTWKDYVYACGYAYAGGATMTLSVKEMSSPDETTAYYNSLATRLGKTGTPIYLGEGGFSVRDGSVVVRKDYKVLLVDVSKLPAQFGVPADPRGDIAQHVADTIMTCWKPKPA